MQNMFRKCKISGGRKGDRTATALCVKTWHLHEKYVKMSEINVKKRDSGMIRAAFCDDDRSVLNELQVLMDGYREERNQKIICTAFNSPLELIAQIEKGMRFDVLFLDVLMPGVDGIETAQEIRAYDSAMKIIFLTSSAEYAVQSYTVNAYFYQMKPICQENFYRLMDSVIGECEKAQKENLIIKSRRGVTQIELDQLIYCEVRSRTLAFHMQNGEVIEGAGGMDDLSRQLAEYDNFLRVHRSYLVNMEYIKTISYKAVLMINQDEIPVPHGKCSEIKNQYLEYVFSKGQMVFR